MTSSFLAIELMLTVMAAFTAGGLVWALWEALAPDQPLVRRAQLLREERDGRRRDRRAAAGRETLTPAAVLKRVARRVEGLRSHAGSEVAERLARAGWRSRDAVVLFLLAKIALPFVGGALALVAFNGLHLVTLDPVFERIVPAAGVLVGFLAPGYVVDKVIAGREQTIGRALPDALDLLVICAEAGLSLDFAMQRVAAEMEDASPEIAEEFAIASAERRLLPERRTALENLARRCQIAPVRALVQTLLQAEQYGTALSQSLRVVAGELRTERMLKAEEKASKLPVKMTVPLVFFIMPALFIVLLGPGIIRTMEAFSGV